MQKAWSVCSIAVFAFAAGALITARADANRLFELRVYHATPGKVPALESRFRDTASKLLAKHHLNAVGYWVPDDNSNTFIYIVAHASREDAKQNWDELRADPAFLEMGKSEQTEKLVEKVDSTYMHPTDFSAMK